MKLGWHALRILVVLGALAAAGCSLLPQLGSRKAPSPTPLALTRCENSSGILCVVTFGIEPPDQMLIALLAPLGGLEDIHVDVAYHGHETAYTCRASTDFPRNIYCTGPQIPLGSTIRIDVSTGDGKTPLASGDFLLAAFALPTLSSGAPTAAGTAYPNPSTALP